MEEWNTTQDATRAPLNGVLTKKVESVDKGWIKANADGATTKAAIVAVA